MYTHRIPGTATPSSEAHRAVTAHEQNRRLRPQSTEGTESTVSWRAKREPQPAGSSHAKVEKDDAKPAR